VKAPVALFSPNTPADPVPAPGELTTPCTPIAPASVELVCPRIPAPVPVALACRPTIPVSEPPPVLSPRIAACEELALTTRNCGFEDVPARIVLWLIEFVSPSLNGSPGFAACADEVTNTNATAADRSGHRALLAKNLYIRSPPSCLWPVLVQDHVRCDLVERDQTTSEPGTCPPP
jgi:hypothetical protein